MEDRGWWRRGSAILLFVGVGAVLVACGSSAQVDAEFPPGDPTLAEPGDNPVLGSEGPGVVAETDTTNYGLLALIAVCLIAAGVLLVKVESWERKRSAAIAEE